MTLLEFAEKTSTVPLMDWQKEFFAKYQEAVERDKILICNPPRVGRVLTMDLIKQYQERSLKDMQIDVYCQGVNKKGIPCKRYLGRIEGKAKLLCPICKTVNIVDTKNVEVK